MSGLKLVTIDKKAIDPLGPVKPKKMLLIIIGIVFGLMLGLVAAVVRGTVQSRRENSSDTTLLPHSSIPAKKRYCRMLKRSETGTVKRGIAAVRDDGFMMSIMTVYPCHAIFMRISERSYDLIRFMSDAKRFALGELTRTPVT